MVSLHVHLLFTQLVEDCVLAALLVKAGLHERQSLAESVEVRSHFLHALAVVELGLEAWLDEVKHSLAHLRFERVVVYADACSHFLLLRKLRLLPTQLVEGLLDGARLLCLGSQCLLCFFLQVALLFGLLHFS